MGKKNDIFKKENTIQNVLTQKYEYQTTLNKKGRGHKPHPT